MCLEILDAPLEVFQTGISAACIAEILPKLVYKLKGCCWEYVLMDGPPRFTDTRLTDNTKSLGIHIWGPRPQYKKCRNTYFRPRLQYKSVGIHICGPAPSTSVGIHIWGPAPNTKSVWIHIWGKIYVCCDENYVVRV
jgi:hypothetical protein